MTRDSCLLGLIDYTSAKCMHLGEFDDSCLTININYIYLAEFYIVMASFYYMLNCRLMIHDIPLPIKKREMIHISRYAVSVQYQMS